MLRLGLLLLFCSSAFALKVKPKGGETVDYICIGQGQSINGRRIASAETHVRIRLPVGKEFDKLKEPTPATATLFGLQLHGLGKTDKLGKAVVVKGTFEYGKSGPRAGHNFDAKLKKGGPIRELHINMGNSTRNPSWLKYAKGNKTVDHFMLCQWQ